MKEEWRVAVVGVFLLSSSLLLGQNDSKGGLMESLITTMNSKSLDFYGVIIDQNHQPVDGVKVTAGVGLAMSMTRSDGRNYYTESDEAGRFRFVGIRGSGCAYILSKEGYIFNERLPQDYRADDYVPDPNKPVIFPIWRLVGPEPLMETKIRAGLACDGTPRRFDVLTGRKDTGGLIVTLVRNPIDLGRNRSKPFDWTLTISMPEGGLVEVNDDYPFEAPNTGYKPSASIAMLATSKAWTAISGRSYYIFDGKHYGRIIITIIANHQPPPTHFEIQSYVNPSGSRNLEFDATKQVN